MWRRMPDKLFVDNIIEKNQGRQFHEINEMKRAEEGDARVLEGRNTTPSAAHSAAFEAVQEPARKDISSEYDRDGDVVKKEKIGICFNFAGTLEAMKASSSCRILEVASMMRSTPAPQEHRLLIYRGKLLDKDTTLSDALVKDGTVLHLTLNEVAQGGKPLHVRDTRGCVRTVMCHENSCILDIKEDLACFPSAPPPEEQQLVFAGRVLANGHTLREYNIQKPSVLLLLPHRPPPLEQHIARLRPARGEVGVVLGGDNSRAPSLEISVEFRQPTFAGEQIPIITSLIEADFEVRTFFGQGVVGSITYDTLNRRVLFTPDFPLESATHYRVMLNRNNGMWVSSGEGGQSQNSSDQARLPGAVKFDFFTEGYTPLRLTAAYPRPFSRVRPKTACIVVSFSRPLCRGAAASDWVTVRVAGGGGGCPLKQPWYDDQTMSLVFEPVTPFPPNQELRVRVRPQLICGADGESLFPLQQDGILKTTSFRWKFFTTHGSSEVSRYEYNNMSSAGVGPVVRKWQEGRLMLLSDMSAVKKEQRGSRGSWKGERAGLGSEGTRGYVEGSLGRGATANLGHEPSTRQTAGADTSEQHSSQQENLREAGGSPKGAALTRSFWDTRHSFWNDPDLREECNPSSDRSY